MASKWIKTKFTGVRYREHETRKHGVQRDRYFVIRYKLDGKDKEESLGWASDGWTAQKASLELARLKENIKRGVGYHSLQEKRESEAARREVEARQRVLDEKSSITFNQVWEQYFAQCLLDGKRSMDREEGLFRLWIEPVIGKRTLTEVNSFLLEKIKHKMSKAELSPRSIHYCIAVIRQVFNFAIRRDLFNGANPTIRIKKPTEDNRRIRYLTHEEAGRLMDAIKDKSNDCWRLCMVSLHTGMRFSEIARLTFGDLDFERGTVWVRQTKNGRSRHVPMSETIKDVFLGINGGGNDDLVFPGRNGKVRVSMSDTFERVVNSLGLNAGITDHRQRLVFHSLRHTCASWLAESGTDLFVVKELLGHRSISMTERYSHLGPTTMKNAVDRMNQAIDVSRES